jgi:hypothetical protein
MSKLILYNFQLSLPSQKNLPTPHQTRSINLMRSAAAKEALKIISKKRNLAGSWQGST